jgi:hypothetical protein
VKRDISRERNNVFSPIKKIEFFQYVDRNTSAVVVMAHVFGVYPIMDISFNVNHAPHLVWVLIPLYLG